MFNIVITPHSFDIHYDGRQTDSFKGPACLFLNFLDLFMPVRKNPRQILEFSSSVTAGAGGDGQTNLFTALVFPSGQSWHGTC
jgi:hypothetical protein